MFYVYPFLLILYFFEFSVTTLKFGTLVLCMCQKTDTSFFSGAVYSEWTISNRIQSFGTMKLNERLKLPRIEILQPDIYNSRRQDRNFYCSGFWRRYHCRTYRKLVMSNWQILDALLAAWKQTKLMSDVLTLHYLEQLPACETTNVSGKSNYLYTKFHRDPLTLTEDEIKRLLQSDLFEAILQWRALTSTGFFWCYISDIDDIWVIFMWC